MSKKERLKYKGYWVEAPCPECGGRLMENLMEETWCSECDFGLEDYTKKGTATLIVKNERLLSET